MAMSTDTAQGGPIAVSEISCLIQADGLAVGHEQELARRLQKHHLTYYPSDEPAVRWRRAEPGRMFTAGEPSRTSTVSCTIGATTSRSEREVYMRGVCDLWTEVTGCSEHDVLVSISEVPSGVGVEVPAKTGQE